MRSAAWTIYCAEWVLSRIAHWKHLEINVLRDSRIFTMEQSNSSTYEFRYPHRVIRDYLMVYTYIKKKNRESA